MMTYGNHQIETSIGVTEDREAVQQRVDGARKWLIR